MTKYFASQSAEYYPYRVSLGPRGPDGDPEGIVHRAALVPVGLFQLLGSRFDVASEDLLARHLELADLAPSLLQRFSVEGVSSENGCGSSLRVDLLLYHRFRWLSRGYWIGVSMHNLPNTVFTPKDARNAQGNRSEILASANLGPVPLYLYDVGKLRSCVLRYVLKANDLAIL